jgi:hypothetical protein
MLVTTDEKVSFQIGSYAPLRAYLEPVPAHTLFRIRRGSEEAVKELLATMGFDYRMPSSSIEPDDEERAAVADDATVKAAWEPIVAVPGETQNHGIVLRGKKYGSGLKAFDLNETIHIIDYAVLTGASVVIDYAGSPLVKKGVHSVKPLSCGRGIEPILEGIDGQGRKKQFLIRKIGRIGVDAP